MSNAKATAEKIVSHLESRDKENRGFNGVLGRMKRKEHKALIDEIANLVEGKPAVPEDTGATAQGGGAATGAGGKTTGATASKTGGGKAAQA